MALKTPISMLQEIMAFKKEALPNYLFESVGDLLNPQFRCTVKVSSITADACARNKKEAKQMAAANAIKMLKGFEVENSPEKNDTLKIPANGVEDPPADYCVGVNYVGQLNEHTSRTVSVVQYEDSYIIANNQFEVLCTWNTNETRGYARTKKDAKQIAAFKMLLQLKSPRLQNSLKEKQRITESSDDLDSRAIAKFSELSTSKIRPVNTIDMKVEACKEIEQKHYTLEEAIEELKNLNLSYVMETLQQDPCMVVVQIKEKAVTTMGLADTEYDATVDAMNKAIDALSVGCSFTAE